MVSKVRDKLIFCSIRFMPIRENLSVWESLAQLGKWENYLEICWCSWLRRFADCRRTMCCSSADRKDFPVGRAGTKHKHKHKVWWRNDMGGIRLLNGEKLQLHWRCGYIWHWSCYWDRLTIGRKYMYMYVSVSICGFAVTKYARSESVKAAHKGDNTKWMGLDKATPHLIWSF